MGVSEEERRVENWKGSKREEKEENFEDEGRREG